MKLSNKEKQAVLVEAAALFNNEDYPFSVEMDGDRLFCIVDWKNATFLGLGSISKEVATYRYIVKLEDDGTFHGYDMDIDTMAKANLKGHVRVSGNAFAGHEIRFHKEIGVDAENGVQMYGFNTEKIHKPVKEFFEKKGFTYKEPDVQMVVMEGSGRTIYKALGVLFSLLGIAGTVLFLSIGVWPALFFTGLFIALGFWALGVGLGKAWMPIFSAKMVIKITVGVFAVSWGLVMLVMLILALTGGIK